MQGEEMIYKLQFQGVRVQYFEDEKKNGNEKQNKSFCFGSFNNHNLRLCDYLRWKYRRKTCHKIIIINPEFNEDYDLHFVLNTFESKGVKFI